MDEIGSDLTKSQVNRAGRLVRKYLLGTASAEGPARVERAIETILTFRAAHQYPLTKANMGLRSVLQSEQCRIEVSQRLKRVPTIFDKLRREPTMTLANMHDIGGCRAILDSSRDIRRVERRLKRNRPILRIADYIIEPRRSGYRALHIVVSYADHLGVDRAIEIQLRTQIMHDWAWTVERLGGRLGVDLKSGVGPKPVLEFLEAASEAMAIEESEQEVSPDMAAKVNLLREAALPYIDTQTRRS
ncbi:MAG: RelA/SpoT domain-containing protein [Candidatus Dormibacteria bacterium]